MVWISFDITDFTVSQMDANAAPASAHVAGGVPNFNIGTSHRRGSGVMKGCDRHAMDVLFADVSKNRVGRQPLANRLRSLSE
jgi:hypothetical protein